MRALTHCSASPQNNERFEFLGDSLLNFIIAEALFEKFSHFNEGQLSRLRAHLVQEATLALIAQEICLGDYLILGQGELKSGGFRRASILSDTLEAIIAAIFLDNGLISCRQVILYLFEARLNDPELETNLKDPKTQLQEYVQAQKISLPTYTLTGITGQEHEQIFNVTCEVHELHLTSQGTGPNRRKAEQEAAKILFNKIVNNRK